MVTKNSVVETHDVESLKESDNISLTDSKLDNGSKGQLIKVAGQLRDRRNDLNQMASERASLRDELNAKTREKVDEAQKHREKRDELNEQVQEHKDKRNELNAEAYELFDQVEGLRGNFDHYDTHVKTAVYEARGRDRNAVVSIWDTASAAETAAGFLSELPDVVSRAGEGSGFGTMGMFYTVKPDYREEFHDTFDTVEEVLGGRELGREVAGAVERRLPPR